METSFEVVGVTSEMFISFVFSVITSVSDEMLVLFVPFSCAVFGSVVISDGVQESLDSRQGSWLNRESFEICDKTCSKISG